MAFVVILSQLSRIYRHNNFVGDLTVTVAFAVIFFQLSRIYLQNKSVGNPFSNSLYIYIYI